MEGDAEGARANAERRATSLARLRLIAFLVAVGSLVAGVTVLNDFKTPLEVTAGLLAVAFVILIVIHARARKERDWHAELRDVADEAQRRMDRDWDAVRDIDASAPLDHAFAADLDVTGHASLMALLGGGATRPGTDTLLGWLMTPATPDVLRSRQDAVRELRDEVRFRHEISAHGRLAKPVFAAQLERLVSWAEEPSWLLPSQGLRALSIAVPIGNAIAIGLHTFDVLPYTWILTLAVSFWGHRITRERVRETLDCVSWGDADLHRYEAIIRRVVAHEFESPVLQTLAGGLHEGADSAPHGLARLFRLVELSDLRFNGNIHVPLQFLGLWDLHMVARLERWKARNGTAVRRWLEVMGEVDAMSALAGLAHAHPEWSFPELDATLDSLSATALGHPLLSPGQCIANDVTVGPPGGFLLVTGSNMSGKSTLLRAIGANVVLAGAGGPVCATSLRLPPVTLQTSMRVQDSLEAGVSFFMAELQRLKRVTDAAQASPRLLYLLDEILQGTNTAERQIAARRIIRYLLNQGAIGAVTTHDLSLADVEDLNIRAHAVHFGEAVTDDDASLEDVLLFDYTLHEGIATSTNALKLLKIVGLGADDEALRTTTHTPE